jgi:hypothetical protein
MNFGFDPELFVLRKGSNKASSVHLMGVQDDFESLKTAQDDAKTGAGDVWLKTDGFAAELNCRATSCRDYLIPYTAAVLRAFYKQYGDNWRLSAVPVMELNKKSVTGKVPFGVNEFGCLPDMDAYSLTEKTPPRDDYHNDVRYIGGHLHKQLNEYSATNYEKELTAEERMMFAAYVTLQLDIKLGLPLVGMLGRNNDYGEPSRRAYYGQAGSFRLKDYGVEYRVLSGAVMLSPILLAWALGVVKTVSHMSPTGDLVDHVKKLNDTYDFARVRDIIDGHNVQEARKFVYTHRETMLKTVPEFYDLMVEADIGNKPLNTNLFEAWALDGPIRNHSYMGVHNLMAGRQQFSTTVFPVKPVVEKKESWSF